MNISRLCRQALSRTGFIVVLLIAIWAQAAKPAHGATATAPKEEGLQPVAELAHRVVPWMDGRFVLIRIPKDAGQDVFELRTEGSKLAIRASDPVSAAMGLNYYLKYYCHRSMSLVGENLAPVKVLPALATPVHRTSRFKYRYFLNYCTFNKRNRSGMAEHASKNGLQRQ